MFLHWSAGTLREKWANLFLSSETNTDDVVNLYKRTGSDTLTEQALTWSPTTPTETYEMSANPQGTSMVWHGVYSSNEYFRVYDFDNATSTFTERVSQIGSNQDVIDVAWDPLWTDGGIAFVTIQGITTRYLKYWTRSGNTITGTDLTIDVAGLGYDPYEDSLSRCVFNPTGTHLAMAYGANAGNVRLRIATRSGTAFTDLLAVTNSTFTGLVNSIDYSPDGTRLAVTVASVPYVAVYNISGTTYTKLADSTFGSGNRPTGAGPVAWNHNASSLACASSDVVIYNVSGDTFTKVTTVSISGTALAVKWSQDGTELYVLTTSSPYFYVFARVNDTFTSVGTLSPTYGETPNRILNYCFV